MITMVTKDLSRRELVEQSFDCCQQCVRSYGPTDLSEQVRTNLVTAMEYFKTIALCDIDKEGMKMDYEIIDRIIKASFDCWNEHKRFSFTVAYLSDSEKDFAKRHAIAIIKAVREPTDKMVAAIHGCYPGIPDKYAHEIAKQKWEAAIDCILND